MNEADLQRIGNANFRMTSSITQPRQLSPLRIQQQQSPSKLLNVQSNIGNLNNLFCSHCHEEHNDNHAKCTKTTKTKWDTFAPYMFNKLSKQEKDRTFLQLYDDYRGVKGKLNEQVHKIKRLTTKLHSLQQELGKFKTGGANAGEIFRFQKQKQQEIAPLKQQIKRLHQKIIALTTGTKSKIQNRPKTANKTQKVVIPVNENVRLQLQNERKHVRQLLLIIDELKKNKFEVEEQLRNKQANQSQINKSVVRNPSKNYNRNTTQSQFQQYAVDLMNWKQKYSDLELAYNRMNEDKDRKIKELSTELITIKENERMKARLSRTGGIADQSEKQRLEEKIREITNEKEKIQSELRKLVQMPFYQNNKQIIQSQQKITTLELKYEKMKSELAKVSESSSKYFAQLEFKNRENALLKSQNDKVKKQIKQMYDKELSKTGTSKIADIDYDDYYRKKLALVKLQGNDPVWKQFEGIAKPQINLMNQQALRSLAQKLWISKLELLGHLQKAQVELKTLRQGMDSRINLYIKDKQSLEQELKIARARLDEWKSMDRMNQRKPFKVYEQAGIKYDDTISVFDIEEVQMKELESNENYFDFYLGNLNIDQTRLIRNSQNKVKNMSHFISFLTIDFYNHETQHSNFAEGVMKKLGNNYSFKVEVNSYFLKYLSKNAVSIQLWSPQGTATVLLGKGQIYLFDLINKAAQDISNVIRGKCQIYDDKTLIATVEYRFRMRLPIGPFLEWAQSKKQFKISENRDVFAISKKRLLEISVDRAQQLPVGISAFVYFTVQQQDFFTQPERGPNPTWNFKQQIQVAVDQEFIDKMKQNYFKFTIFDDEKAVNEDVYGIANADFTPLVQDSDSLDLTLNIQDRNGNKRGKLKVKARWLSY